MRIRCHYVWVCSLMTKLVPNSDLCHRGDVTPFIASAARCKPFFSSVSRGFSIQPHHQKHDSLPVVYPKRAKKKSKKKSFFDLCCLVLATKVICSTISPFTAMSITGDTVMALEHCCSHRRLSGTTCMHEQLTSLLCRQWRQEESYMKRRLSEGCLKEAAQWLRST